VLQKCCTTRVLPGLHLVGLANGEPVCENSRINTENVCEDVPKMLKCGTTACATSRKTAASSHAPICACR
jgi:hypothetical protein